MARLRISAPTLRPSPMLVMALLRAMGGSSVDIAAALINRAPLLDEDLPEFPPPEQAARVRSLLKLLGVTAVAPVILLGDRPLPEQQLHELLEAPERLAAGSARPAPGPG
jgi:hypothetical protein